VEAEVSKNRLSVSEYRARLVTADLRLKTLAEDEVLGRPDGDNARAQHLLSKAEGVRLALSYLDEMLR
jgi:hypothetical protein